MMASTTQTTSAAQIRPTNPSNTLAPNGHSRGHFMGGRGSNRGGRFNGQRGSQRGGSMNRGNRIMGDNISHGRRVSGPENRPAPPIPPPPGLGGGGSFGDRLTEDATVREGEGLQQHDQEEDRKEDDVEAEVCFICASEVKHNSVAPCNHRTCHICALRLRALYKTRACAHCRVGLSCPWRC